MTLPLWFLVTALVLPRIALFCGWFHGWQFYVPQPAAGLLWAFVPRLIVLLLIATVMGLCPWFWVHLGVALMSWTFSFIRSRDYRREQRGKQS